MLTPFVKTNINVVNMKNHISTEYDFYIGRPSALGNPYTHLKSSKASKHLVATRKEAIEAYDQYMRDKIASGDKEFIGAIDEIINIYKEYGRVNLCCFCKPLACHGDYIKKYIDKILTDGI